MGSSEPGVYYATQAGCEELWRGGGAASGPWPITIETLCRQHQSVVPQEVSEITPLGVPGGRWDADSQLLIGFSSYRTLSLSLWPHVVVVL